MHVVSYWAFAGVSKCSQVDLAMVPPLFRGLPQAPACNVTLPTSRSQDPELWFIQVDAKFQMHRIVSQNNKYDLRVDVLQPQSARDACHHFVAPHPQMPYGNIKQALLSGLVT